MEENINLVYYLFNKHFKQYQYLKDDLISEGLLALCRAEKYFDETKGIQKSTYLSKAIYMAMFKFIKKEQSHENDVSLYDSIPNTEDLDYIDLIPAPDVIEAYLTNEAVSQIFKTKITDRDKQIINLYSNGRKQTEIAELMNLSQPLVARAIKKVKRICAKEMGGD